MIETDATKNYQWIGKMKQASTKRLNIYPAGTQRYFNVHLTLFGRCERQMDVETTLCASWVRKDSRMRVLYVYGYWTTILKMIMILTRFGERFHDSDFFPIPISPSFNNESAKFVNDTDLNLFRSSFNNETAEFLKHTDFNLFQYIPGGFTLTFLINHIKQLRESIY